MSYLSFLCGYAYKAADIDQVSRTSRQQERNPYNLRSRTIDTQVSVLCLFTSGG